MGVCVCVGSVMCGSVYSLGDCVCVGMCVSGSARARLRFFRAFPSVVRQTLG